jgi:prephenate dehydratase
MGDYCFSIDCEGHLDDERVGDALAALHRVCADVRYLGSYERRDGQQGPVPVGRTNEEFVESRDWLARVRETGR